MRRPVGQVVQDSGLSRRQQGFESPTGHENEYLKLMVGVNSVEGPPVPIPNTEVKLIGAENTWLATAREDRAMPT